ncbi:flagellar biosynthesis/type III secretory pathway lipoprotein [Pelotomaculum thermopropionicum SI]|uniref:Flagellar M-ring protein n=1 Tax=Pelotomaculum thermopropionicum (strain DSM 13744 / JCM 10971 / SI) TaxID=370438 RepID=A5D0F7_PELTS|nr:flagellar biosynthesis/type III secretory pathway lipoprotein [Pelotomaculum thermopropionicum SI]
MSPGDLAARFRERWQSLSQTQKVISVLVASGALVCLFYLGQLATRPAYAPLFTGLEPKDAGVIVDELKALKIPYQIADEGKTIKVPEDKVYEVRIQLASSGALGGGGMGFELFDQSKLGQTDFEQQVGYQRALQEELRRTIVQLEGVEQARVHLVIPQKSVFIGERGTPSAAVALKLKPAARLKPEQVQGICDLLVGSVEGLKPENVHIIDTEGNVLSDDLKSGEWAVGTKTALEHQKARREYEKELEKRVQQMLTQIMGQNKAVAMVTADLDFNQQQTTSTVSSNPNNLRISEHIVRETGGGTEAGGPPGTDSNLSTYPALQGAGTTNYSREESTINYQVNTVQETVVKAPGTVRRLSASVVLNETDGPVDVQKVRDVVAAAIGYDQARGDQINVSSMAFDDSYLKKVEAEMAEAESRARFKERLYLYALSGGALLLVVLSILALLLWRRRAVQRVEEEPEFVTVREMQAQEERRIREDKQEQIRDMAKERPKDVAEILKVWLKD